MSRFDLFFIILDECNAELDENIARHIVSVHRDSERKKLLSTSVPFNQEQLQRYIRFAKCISPQITPEAHKVLVECYRLLRNGDSTGKNKSAYRITVRQLESLIRLSEALARLHLDPYVSYDANKFVVRWKGFVYAYYYIYIYIYMFLCILGSYRHCRCKLRMYERRIDCCKSLLFSWSLLI